jgi:hypothetical protein
MKKVLAVLVVIVAVVLGFICTRPNQFHVERQISIAAPDSVVFAALNDFHVWPQWSPWEKYDPQLKRAFDGPASGVGAKYHWAGNQKVGEGSMAITESHPNDREVIQIEFVKPYAAVNTITFTLAPDGGKTRVIWGLDGKNNFMTKTMSIFMPMDKMVGPDFERGLLSLKDVSEAAMNSPAAAPTTAPAP